MQKPNQLQQRLIEQIPLFQFAPEKLVLITGQGYVVATAAASLSFEYRYPLTLTITDDDAPLSEQLVDQVVVTILGWLRVNQPEILGNASHRLSDFTFTQQEHSLTLMLQLTERVQVADQDDVRTITYSPEPPLPEPVTRPKALYVNGELVSQWEE